MTVVRKAPAKKVTARKRAAKQAAAKSVRPERGAHDPEDGDFLGRRIAMARAAAARALESLDDVGQPKSPTEDDIGAVAHEIREAAHDDPAAFAFLGEDVTEERLRDDLKDAFALEHGRDLTAEQRDALEAIVLLRERPSLLVRDNDFAVPGGYWSMLAVYRQDITRVVRSVGRINVAEGAPYIGTGFVVGRNLVMTNAHVAEVFAARDGAGWAIKAFLQVSIDFKQEHGSAARNEFPVTGVVCIHDRHDLALLRIATVKGAAQPKALPIQKNAGYAAASKTVYTVGFPAADSDRNAPTETERIFFGVYEKKRLAPGCIMSVERDRAELTHDCATLGGSSGCCVVDMDTNSVVGLHQGGIYRKFNSAVLLPALAEDPLLASVNFR